MADILEYTKRNNLPGLFLCIDFEKAFDSLEWKFLFLTLKNRNFGPSFIHWVETLYRNILSCIINNGHTSPYFAVKRGVRQGDPLSPYLFIIAIEILAQAVRANPNIQGIKVGEREEKLLQYADDATGVLRDVKSAKNFLDTTKVFGGYSGLKLNVEKTEGFWLGSWRHSAAKPLGISWTKHIKITGAYFSYQVS